jgi:hypothetical protein
MDVLFAFRIICPRVRGDMLICLLRAVDRLIGLTSAPRNLVDCTGDDMLPALLSPSGLRLGIGLLCI